MEATKEQLTRLSVTVTLWSLLSTQIPLLAHMGPVCVKSDSSGPAVSIGPTPAPYISSHTPWPPPKGMNGPTVTQLLHQYGVQRINSSRRSRQTLLGFCLPATGGKKDLKHNWAHSTHHTLGWPGYEDTYREVAAPTDRDGQKNLMSHTGGECAPTVLFTDKLSKSHQCFLWHHYVVSLLQCCKIFLFAFLETAQIPSL